MRKGLFAIVLVAASFSGGALVNGPGLRWARDLILNQPGAEIATTTLDEPTADAGDGGTPVAEIPSAPIPPLVVAPATTPAPEPSTKVADAEIAAAKGDPAQPRLAAPEPKAPEPPQSQRSGPPTPIAQAPAPPDPAGIPPEAATVPIAVESPPALEPPTALATSKEHDDASRDRPRAGPRDPGAATTRPDTPAAPADPEIALAAMSPEGRPVPAPAPAPAASTSGRGPDDWGAIRRQMRALGVARYGIDGEPDGRVRFHCVIPLAGRRAVGQQFEAEGDDAIEAAQTALRRVALWRATEHPAR